ncbi:MAG: DUF11 domain-containing protein [Anaerolineae bacterium]|nr:DUF11 domain-containing protein [Anaerolineae bacterium]
MVRGVRVSLVSHRERLRYGFGAVCIGIAALLFLVSFHGGAAQGLAAPTAPTIMKSSVTSIDEANNALSDEAVAGELVTVTVVYNVPSSETIYDASLRVMLQDGLYPTASNPTWSEIYTGTRSELLPYEPLIPYGRNGALVIFPDEPIITGTDAITMVIYAVRTQYEYVESDEIRDNTRLRTQAVLRYCETSGCTTKVAVNDDSYDAQVYAIRPEISAACTETYLDSAGVGAGNGQVQLNFAGNLTGRPAAYNVVFTATVGAELTYDASNGGTDSPGPGGVTYVVWNRSSLLVGDTWQPVVTATLPLTFTIGREFACQGMATYETFAGDVPYEGKYTTTGEERALHPGLSVVAKSSLPGSGAVTMGDTVTYTVVFWQGANTLLQAPQVVDTQPLGFHYVPDTFVIQGADTISVTTSQGTTEGSGDNLRHYEDLKWTMSDLSLISTARVVTATYVAFNTGLDYDGLPVYWSAADIKASKTTISTSKTGAVLSWTPPAGSSYSAAARANASTLYVIQPFMGDHFSTLRTDGGEREIGQSVNLAIRFHNYGAVIGQAIPAHELEVCDTLPTGMTFEQNNGCFVIDSTTPCPFTYTPPSIGDEGVVCWQVPALERTTTIYEFKYQAGIGPATIPGIHTNGAYVTTYSSQSGTVEGERVYSEFPEALPSANCGTTCMTILGLEGNKIPWDARVAPGDLLTYTLLFTDTSLTNNYTGLLVTDTYDSLLSFVDATPTPISHDAGTRTLVWDLGAVPDGGNQQIILTMQVDSEIEAHYALTNTMMWDSDQTTPHALSKVTEIDVADLYVDMSGSEFTHAGGDVVLTVVYSNTGSWDSAPVTLTLDYGPYLTYVSASPLAPVAGTQDRVFVDTVPNDGVSKTLTINLTTNAPLPYTLEEIVSTVTLASSGAPSQADVWTTTLQRPVFSFQKMGPSVAAMPPDGTMLYTFELVNTGDYTATNLVITDTWDAATSFRTSAGWTPDGSGMYATYAIPSLAPGATATVNPLTVQVDSLEDSYLNQADLQSTQTTSQHTELEIWSHSIALAKTAYPDPAFPGRVLTYTLYYTNTGGGIVNAVVIDTLPDGFSFGDQSTANASGCSTGWSFDHTDPYATWSCTALLQNATGYFQIWGVVTAEENTELVNMAQSDGADVPTRPMDEPLRTLVARPWLRVDKAGVPTHPVAPDDYITYTLTYENYGSYTAYDVVVKDELPGELTFAGCDHGCTHDVGLVSWLIGEVPVDTTGEVVVYATVNAGTGGQTAVNSNYTIENATVWQELLPSETEKGDPVNTTILDPQLTLTKAAAPTVVQNYNDTIVYTITYANTGGGLLHNVAITDELDIYTSFTSAPAGCVHDDAAAGGTVVCQLGDLANGESRQIVIRVRVLPGLTAGDTIPNQAQGRTDEAPLTSSNTTTVWYQVAAYPEIVLTPMFFDKSASEGSPVIEDTLTVSNEGDADLLWSAEVMTPTEATWLRISVGGGDPDTIILPRTTAPGGSTDVTVYFDPTGLSAVIRDYTGWLRILSNDEDEAEVLVPVTFTIVMSDYYIYLPLVLRNYQ